MIKRDVFLPAAMVLIVSLAGCSGDPKDPLRKPTVPVKGVVNYKGKPLEGATITFVMEGDAIPAYGKTDAEGKFTLKTYDEGDGAVIGLHTVAISKIENPPATGIDQEGGKYVPPEGGAPPKTVYLIPQKYSLPGLSGLKAEVKAEGPNEFTFDLTE